MKPFDVGLIGRGTACCATTPPPRWSPFALLVRFVGAGASSLVFGETFGPLQLSGMIILVLGVAIMLLSKPQHTVPNQVVSKDGVPKEILPKIA